MDGEIRIAGENPDNSHLRSIRAEKKIQSICTSMKTDDHLN